MAKLIKLYPDKPHPRAMNQIIEVLKNDGLIIYPTDTVYSLGCSSNSIKGMLRIAKLKNIKPEKLQLSIVCNDLSHLSTFTKPIENSVFRLLKHALPGPFTFILEAANQLPPAFKGRKTIGIRIPNHKVPEAIAEALGVPLCSSSIHHDNEFLDYITDPELIADNYANKVDLIIDSGMGGNIASTIVDLTQYEPNIIRQGLGNLDDFL
jgi:tRNA threonylcarbamoyl adenosine modification protein (Sua5/YciO/YrdC/YwlC family)